MRRALRLVSLAIPDAGEPANHSAPAVLDGVTVDHVIATGASVAEALASVEWQAEELLVLGSSRMAAQGRLFLGTTAGRIVREVPVPVVVVPRGDDEDTTDDTTGGRA